jgi:hypothetical protein
MKVETLRLFCEIWIICDHGEVYQTLLDPIR